MAAVAGSLPHAPRNSGQDQTRSSLPLLSRPSRVMQPGSQNSPSPQQRETGARSHPDQTAGTAAQALGSLPQPEPVPSERCSSASPARSLGGHAPQEQNETLADAMMQTAPAERQPALAPPHAQASEAAGGQEPALLLQLLAEEACRAGSVATGA